MRYAVFDGIRDAMPKSRETDWPALKARLQKFDVLTEKGGRLWSPAAYRDGAQRGNAGVLAVEALVLDFDGGHDPLDYLTEWDGLEFAVHSTWSSTPERPKWRAVFPLAAPVPASEWRAVYKKLSLALGRGAADPSCSDPARIYYLPSHPPEAEPFAHSGSGRLLDPAEYPDPEAEELEARTGLNGSGKPGDDYNAKATWDEILVPHGWRRSDRRDYNGQTLWIRPGKPGSREISARTGIGEAGDRFYCWSSSAGVPPNRLLTKFGLLAHLEFGGDYSACARELRRRGYGGPAEIRLTEREGGATAVEFPLTDLGNAERLIHLHGRDLRHCHVFGKWLVWDGKRWKLDETGGARIMQLAHGVVRGMQREAALIDDPDKRKSMAKWAYGCESKGRLSAMAEIARTLPGVPVVPSELDAHPMLLNVSNGTLDLETLELRPHRREDLLTRIAGAAYDPAAICPIWTRFLVRTLDGDERLIRFVWKMAGYSLTGSVTEHVMNFLYGPAGNNGKSTMCEALLKVFGDYGCTTPTDTLMSRSGDPGIGNDLARLKGARLVVAPETEDGKRLNEGLVKRLTGGDTIAARFLHQEFFDFRPEFTIWMVGNHKPVIRGTDDAIWRRIKLIPFEVVIPPDERDRRLGEKLAAEANGILAWMVDGLAAWQREGMEQVETIEKAVQEYRAESDILGAFLEECTEVKENATTQASKLYSSYQEWCKRTGEYAVTQTRFGRAMAERGEAARKTKHGWFYDRRALIEPDYSNVYRGGE